MKLLIYGFLGSYNCIISGLKYMKIFEIIYKICLGDFVGFFIGW